MALKRIFRWVLITIGSILGLLLIFLFVSIGPVDRTPAQELSSYNTMMQRLDSIGNIKLPQPQRYFSVGHGKVSLTPAARTATAGYGKRRGKLFTAIHDSIYVRALVIDNGAQQVAIVSADLLIIPPTVTALLPEKLADTGFSLDNVYLGATHTHNSIGNWGKGATRFIYGAYNDSIVHFIADRIVSSITQASKNKISAVLKTGTASLPDPVKNRLIKNGPEDPLIRMLEIHRQDGTRLLLSSYTAHATCLYSADLELSADYPGKLVNILEKNYDFAIFMAGSVGSHGCNPPGGYGHECINYMADKLAEEISTAAGDLQTINDSVLVMERVPLELSDPQVKITANWKVRSWLFRSAFGEYPSHLTMLRIGDLVMLGTPCDFSGEFNASIDSLAAAQGSKVIVTSFNGGYIGYVTPLKYYDVNHYETQLMNWYAPGTGEYVHKCLQKLLVNSR